MSNRTLANILEDVTAAEQKHGIDSPEVAKLREEACAHPDAAAGKDLPPIIGRMG